MSDVSTPSFEGVFREGYSVWMHLGAGKASDAGYGTMVNPDC